MLSSRVLLRLLLIVLTLPFWGIACTEGTSLLRGAMGKHHGLLLVVNIVSARGQNEYGQLGNGGTSPSLTDWVPTQVAAPSNDVAVGDYHSLALDVNGKVWAWGKNDLGQLGIATFSAFVSTPQQLNLTGIRVIGSGANHNFAVEDSGTIWAWGDNSHGQLGDGTTENRASPVQIKTPAAPLQSFSVRTKEGASPPAVAAMAAGNGFTVVLLNDGTVWACGKNDLGQLGDGTTVDKQTLVRVSGITGVADIAAGDDHVLARKSDGSVWSWGGNDGGQLGDGTTTNRPAPVRVRTAGGSPLSGVVSIAAGSGFSMALVNGGTVWAWGHNEHGQLGDGTTSPRLTATQVPSLNGIKAIQAGGSTALAGIGYGRAWGWGDNSYGQLSEGSVVAQCSPIPLQSRGEAGKVLVTGGDSYSTHFLVLQSNGTAGAWGTNSDGQLGDGTTTNRTHPVPVNTPEAFVSLAAGVHHSLAVDSNKKVWGWGQSSHGQLGDGTFYGADRLQPGLVGGNLPAAIAVAAAGDHSLALGSDGTVWGWGQNRSCQLGQPTDYLQCPLPVLVAGLPSVRAIATGGWLSFGHSLALGNDGKVYAWGNNSYGQLGDGTQTQRQTPVQTVNLDHVAAIAASYDFSLALGNDGRVYGWGYNTYGQLGDGTFETWRLTPVQTVNLDHVAAIAAGDTHSLALKRDGTVWTWGDNWDGQLGTDVGPEKKTSTPVQVGGLPSVAVIAAGGDHSLAVDSNGQVWIWGTYAGGSSPVPTLILRADGSGSFCLLLPVPVALAPTNVTPTGFTATWNTVTGATTYYLDVATDGSFSQFVFGYQNKEVGNVTQAPVIWLDPKTTYYYRVWAVVGGQVTLPSNTVVRFVTAGSGIEPMLLLLLND